MSSGQSQTDSYERGRVRKKRIRKPLSIRRQGSSGSNLVLAVALITAGAFVVYWALEIHARYTFSLQTPMRLRLQWPLVVARRLNSAAAFQAQLDQRRPLTAYQQYTCSKFGDACRLALAIQRAENPEGKCEIYHYNSDGTLDWGYFQINTVHLKRAGLNLRDLLDCKANIDFAFQLYSESDGFNSWSSYKNGAYRKYLHR